MQRTRRGWLLFWVLVPWLLMGLLVGAAFLLYHRPVPAEAAEVTVKPADETKAANLPWPGFGQSAIGTAQDGLLANSGVQTPVPTASTAKIMTALAVLRQKPLRPGQPGPAITITAQDQAIYNDYFAKDGSLARIEVGGTISQYQALQALLLPSANNYADTLVNWAYGNMANYTAAANQLAREPGMTKSYFDDASGFSARTVSTATDMLLLVRAAHANPVLADIVNQKTAVIPMAGQIYNTNGLLGREGITGFKTGNTAEAGGVFTFSAKRALPDGQTVDVLGAVMQGPNLVEAMRAAPPLVIATAQNFVVKQAVQAGQTFGVYTLPWNHTTVKAVAKKETAITTWSGTTVKNKVTLKPLTGHVDKGAEIGSVTVTAGSQTVTAPLVLDRAATAPSAWYRITHH